MWKCYVGYAMLCYAMAGFMSYNHVFKAQIWMSLHLLFKSWLISGELERDRERQESVCGTSNHIFHVSLIQQFECIS